MKTRIFVLIFFSLCCSFYANTINDAQIISSNSYIYKDFQKLQNANKLFGFTQNTPISVGELKFYLQQFNYDDLDENSKTIYDSLHDYLYTTDSIIPVQDFELSMHPTINLEGYYKTNKELPWSFDYYFKDNFISLPLDIGFGKNFAMGTNIFFSKSYPAAQKEDNYFNIPIDIKNPGLTYKLIEFYYPSFAYAGFGKYNENWGYNVFISKQGKTIGNTLTGSIVYNSTFETDAFIEFDIFSKVFKFTTDVVQISSNRMDNIQQNNTERYLYFHQFDVRIFKNLKLSVMEGSLIANPFSIRFLNPLPFMHQFGGWINYVTKENQDIYSETNFCADFAYMLEYIPIKNLRIYGIYNQIEMQLPWERKNPKGRYYPNSIGFQTGLEYNLFLNDNYNLDFNLEVFYNSPFMYIKQTPSASLYRFRVDMQTGEKIYSWIGSPYGPDCLGGKFNIVLNTNNNWKLNFAYSLISKGENDISIFDKIINKDGTDYYDYYPSVKHALQTEDDETISKNALNMKISGIPQITNCFSLTGTYLINNSIEVSAQFLYNYLINYKHIKNINKNGIEIDFAITYKIM